MLDPPPFPPRGHAQAELSKARETIVLLTEEIEALHGRDAADLPGASLHQQLGSWRAQFIVAEVSGWGRGKGRSSCKGRKAHGSSSSSSSGSVHPWHEAGGRVTQAGVLQHAHTYTQEVGENVRH